MIDINELRRLAQSVSGWGNCNQAWLDQSEDTPAAVVGHIDEDGNTYPVATIDCDQYFAAHQSLPLAKLYAAANPSAISELLGRLEAAEKERDALRDEIACVKEVEFPRKVQAVAGAWKGKCERLEAERDALRAKITEMEQQEPVAWRTFDGEGSYDYRSYEDNEEYKLGWDARNPNHIGWVEPLYALPGAQPQLNEIKTALKRALELGQRETWTGTRKHHSWEEQREEQQCWNKVWSLLGAQGEEK